MFEMTVRTPGLTWVRVATNVAEMTAILKAAQLPGCEVEISDKRGVRLPSDLSSSATTAPAADGALPLAA